MRVKAIPLPAPLLEKMAATKQNPRYHAEGSVLEHTMLVVQRFQELKGHFKLDAAEERVLFWASVLHDTGKTEVTRYEDGRWRSPGHEIAGVPIARDLLLQNSELDAAERQGVLDLVRWHGFPLKWVKNNGSVEELKRLGTQTDLRLLSIFSVFDFQGRICEDQTETSGMIDEFHKCHVPKAEYELGKFADLQETFEAWNLRHKNAAWNALKIGNMALLERLMDAKPYSDYETFGKKVYMTVGPPLSGKSSYIEREMPDLFHIKLEDFEIDDELAKHKYYLERKMIEFRHFLTIYLNRHRQVVLEGRNLNPILRAKLNELVRGMDVELEYLVFENSLEELMDRNSRIENPLSKELILEDYRRFDLLHPWEAHKMRTLRH